MKPSLAELAELFVCPRCKRGLAVDPEPPVLRCDACRLLYPVVDGIPVLLVDEATRMATDDASGSTSGAAAT